MNLFCLDMQLGVLRPVLVVQQKRKSIRSDPLVVEARRLALLSITLVAQLNDRSQRNTHVLRRRTTGELTAPSARSSQKATPRGGERVSTPNQMVPGQY